MISQSRTPAGGALLVLSLFLLQSVVCQAQTPEANDKPSRLWPDGISWNSEIPSPKEYFGFDIGRRHLRHDQIVEYLKMLADKSDRVSIKPYGNTQGGRPLLLLTITSVANRQKLDQIRREHRKLSDSAVSGQVDITTLPVVVNMGYSVHGDEPSGAPATGENRTEECETIFCIRE